MQGIIDMSSHRWVRFYDMVLKMHRAELDMPPFKGIMEQLVDAVNTNDGCLYSSRNDTFTLKVVDASIDEERNVATLLIRGNDSTLPDAVYGDLKGTETRHMAKKKGEGNCISVHVTFALNPNANGTYIVLIEESKYLSRTTLQPYLTYLFRHFCENEFKPESGKKAITSYPVIDEFKGHVSEDMKDSLVQGSLTQITLLRETENKKMDQGGVTESIEYITRVTLRRPRGMIVTPGPILDKWWKNKEESQKMRVSFKSPQGKQQTVDIINGSTSWMEANIVKIERLDVERSDRTSESNINLAVVAGMSKFVQELLSESKKNAA